MAHLRIRWPVLSFLELFCCAFGGAAILLLLINREIRGTSQTTRMLRVQIEATLPGEGPTTIEIAARGRPSVVWPSQSPDPNAGFWVEGHSPNPSTDAPRTLMFLCDARARPGDVYELTVRGPSVAGVGAKKADLDRVRGQLKSARDRLKFPALGVPSDWQAVLTAELFESLADDADDPFGVVRRRWKDAFVQNPPDTLAGAEAVVKGRFASARSPGGEDRLELMRLLVALRLAESGARRDVSRNVGIDAQEIKELALPGREKEQAADLRAHLSLRVPRAAFPKRVRIAGEALPTKWDDAQTFGAALPPRLQPGAVLRGGADAWPSLDGAGASLSGRRPPDLRALGAAWFETAELLLKPRDVRVVVAWGSAPPAALNLSADGLLTWDTDEEGRTVIRLTVRVLADGTVFVNDQECLPY